MTPKPQYSNPTHERDDAVLQGGIHFVGSRQPTASKFVRPEPTAPPLRQSTPRRQVRHRWPVFAAGIVVVVSSTVGFGAMALLLKLPAVPNCPRMFLPTASASIRLYCAQLAASKGTTQDLLEAINLVKALPADHPLRPEIDRYLAQWVDDLLALAEAAFQDGKLDAALGLAETLRAYVEVTLIDDRVKVWQEIWQEAESIRQAARDYAADGAWGKAFQKAGSLTKLENRYWATTGYDALFDELKVAQQESKKLDDAFAKVRRGGIDNLLAAIESAGKITRDSSAYQEAQNLITEAKDELIALAMRSLKAGDWQTAMQVVNRVPAHLNLQDQLNDLSTLADAAALASVGSQINLEDAILTAQEIEPGRPLYADAQDLIGQWQGMIGAGLNLEAAIELAQAGSTNALTAAIAQAQTIESNNPRYDEARRWIQQWQAELERRVDQPILDQAVALAQAGNWSQAIAQAQKIGRGRALYGEAQRRIQEWQQQVAPDSASDSTPSDRPTLDRAISLASQGRYSEAIQIAQQIGRGSSLYEEAQSLIRGWQAETQGGGWLSQAEQQARPGTPEALASAIRTASQIPQGSRYGGQAQERINGWSSQLLAIARSRSRNNIREALRIAKLIPANSGIYGTAQAQIATWEGLLNSSPPELPTESTP